jgi:uracil phosphoribosyltransferase
MLTNFQNSNSIINQFVAELRDEVIQQDRQRFRFNMERVGEIIAYEMSKKLKYESEDITTPLGIANTAILKEQPVLATILRAGLPLHNGIQRVFDKADSAYISAFRKTKKDNSFIIEMEYVAVPELENKVLIVSDPMLATGSSMVLCVKELMSRAKFSQVHIVSVIASTIGVQYVQRNLPKAHLWLAAIDDELTTKSYIVPGLGDAGDLAFGEKR